MWGLLLGPHASLLPNFLASVHPLLPEVPVPGPSKACWAVSRAPLSLLVLGRADKAPLAVPLRCWSATRGERRALACRSGFGEPLPRQARLQPPRRPLLETDQPPWKGESWLCFPPSPHYPQIGAQGSRGKLISISDLPTLGLEVFVWTQLPSGGRRRGSARLADTACGRPGGLSRTSLSHSKGALAGSPQPGASRAFC